MTMSPEMSAPPAHYELADLIPMTGLSRNSLYEGCKRGEIPHLRVGRRIIFPRAAIDAWLAGAGCTEAEA